MCWVAINSYILLLFILCKNLQKPFIGLDMKVICHLGCDWTEDGEMFLHQGTWVLINSIDTLANEPYLQTISNIEVPAYSIVTIPQRKFDICTSNTLFVYEIQAKERLTI